MPQPKIGKTYQIAIWPDLEKDLQAIGGTLGCKLQKVWRVFASVGHLHYQTRNISEMEQTGKPLTLERFYDLEIEKFRDDMEEAERIGLI